MKNIFWGCFMFLMVFAKGFGLESGDQAYYVLAAMAVPFWLFCIFQTQWTPRTFVYMALILTVAFAAVVTNRKLGVMLSVMAMAAMKDIDREDLMKTVQRWWLCALGIKLMLVFTGAVPDQAVSLGYKVYHTVGYGTGNVFHATAAVLAMLHLYNRKKKVSFLEVLLILAANLAVYQYSASKGGMLTVAAAVLTSWLFRHYAGNEKMMVWLRKALCLGMAAVVFLSFVLPYVYGTDMPGSRLADFMNHMVSGRIALSRAALLSDPVTLLGNGGEMTAFLDNAYVFLWVKCGVLSALMVFALYVAAIRSMLKRKDDYGLQMVFWFVCYGFVEQFFVNCFMNYSMLVVGHEVMNVVLEGGYIPGRVPAGREEKLI